MKGVVSFFITAVGVVLCAFVGFMVGRWYTIRSMTPQVSVRVRRDTIHIDHPVPVHEAPEGFEFVRVGTVRDLRQRLAALEADADAWAVNPDTVYLSVPIQTVRKTYRGDDYAATVSGWNPALDEITVYPKTVTIETTRVMTKELPPPWTLSPFIGADIGAGTFAARAGVIYGRRLRGDLRLFVGGGYEVRPATDGPIRSGPFATGGIAYQFHP